MRVSSPNQQHQTTVVIQWQYLAQNTQKLSTDVYYTAKFYTQHTLIQHIYPPHHVVRIGMLDSQQSRRTSNWRAGPVVPAKNSWLQIVGFGEEWRCPSCHSAASTFLYCQDPSPPSVWPYSL